MTTSPSLFSPPPPPSSILNIPSSKCKTLCFLNQNPLLESSIALKTTLKNRKRTCFIQSSTSDSPSATVVDNPSSSGRSSFNNSLSNESNEDSTGAKIGARVRVSVPLKVYHVPKVPEFDLTGKVGVIKQYVGIHKGKPISANLPYKVEFVEKVEGRDAPIKFLAHLKEDEFEYVD